MVIFGDCKYQRHLAVLFSAGTLLDIARLVDSFIIYFNVVRLPKLD